MLKEEFRRAFFSWAFLLAIVITSVCFAIGLKEYGPPVSPFIRPEEQYLYPFAQNAFDAFLCAMGLMGPLVFFAPLIAALPFAASFITDRSSGYITFILSRTSFRRYRTSKYIANLLAGGVSTSLPLLVGYGIINIFYKRGFQPIPALGEAWVNVRIPWVNANGTFGYLYRTKPDLYIFFLIGLAFLWGAAWATAGLAVSSAVHNKYRALVAPFLLYVVAHFVISVLGVPEWSPLNNFVPVLYKTTSPVTTFTELGVLFLLSTLGVFALAKKKHVYE
jgi:ABC-type transport system involved in multi-copper enzyme maturation permease subunit